MGSSFKRKILIVDKDFQLRFVKKFATITILGSLISIAIILTFYYFTYKYGGKDLYRFLIEVGSEEKINISPKDKIGRTPLHYASNYQTAAFLIQRGSNVYAQDKRGYSPLHEAALNGYLDIARLFYENGANYDSPAKDGKDALTLYLLKFKAKPIHWWAGTGHPKEIFQILSKDPNQINIQNNLGQSPLHLAALYKRFRIARLLLEKGANADLKDKTGKTALNIFTEKYQSSLLHWWVSLNKDNLVQQVLKAQPKLLNSQDIDGNTALHIAVQNRNLKMVELLLSKKADFNIPNRKGRSALEIAQKTRIIPLVKLFYK